jgi:hypothetical protein
MLTRNYQQLGRQQAEQARKYGVTSGGIALLSCREAQREPGARAAGSRHGPHPRVSGFDLAGTRIGEDQTNALGQAETAYNRGVADRGTGLSRARSEDTFYGLDVDAQKQYQATQAGYEAPQGPANQRTLPNGKVVQDVRKGGYLITYDTSGREISRKVVGPVRKTTTPTLAARGP